MKNYMITVNGNKYEVMVEEVSEKKAAEQSAPATSAPVKKTTASGGGNVSITAATAGKIFKIAVNVGQQVEQGTPIFIIEAMKMEMPVVAPKAGKIVSLDVSVGEAVEAGDVLATMN